MEDCRGDPLIVNVWGPNGVGPAQYSTTVTGTNISTVNSSTTTGTVTITSITTATVSFAPSVGVVTSTYYWPISTANTVSTATVTVSSTTTTTIFTTLSSLAGGLIVAFAMSSIQFSSLWLYLLICLAILLPFHNRVLRSLKKQLRGVSL